MESDVKRRSLYRSSLGLGLILSMAFFTFGCSSSGGSLPNLDAGKDTRSGTGGNSGTGGSSGTGGAISAGGSAVSGGSHATGGSSASGGTTGSGGLTAVGGSGGGSGGSTNVDGGGSGGSTNVDGGGSGGSTNVDGGSSGGSSDGGASDAEDAPLQEGDVPAVSDDGVPGSDGGPTLVDLGVTDAEMVDAGGVDVGEIVLLDAAEDASESFDSPAAVADTAEAVDVVSVDAGPLACLNQIISNGYAVTAAPTPACSSCLDPSNQDLLETQCKGMIDCLLAASCPTSDSHNNCWLTCRNGVSGNQVATETCVSALTTSAGCQRVAN